MRLIVQAKKASMNWIIHLILITWRHTDNNITAWTYWRCLRWVFWKSERKTRLTDEIKQFFRALWTGCDHYLRLFLVLVIFCKLIVGLIPKYLRVIWKYSCFICYPCILYCSWNLLWWCCLPQLFNLPCPLFFCLLLCYFFLCLELSTQWKTKKKVQSELGESIQMDK